MEEIYLSTSSIKDIVENRCLRSFFTLQVMNIEVVKIDGLERIFLQLSDSENFLKDFLLTTSFSKLVESKELSKFSIISVGDGAVKSVNGRTSIILKKLTVIRQNVPKLIGNPAEMEFQPKNCPIMESTIASDNITVISDINSSLKNISICARITNKGEVKTWQNARGCGKLISVHLKDQTGEIVMTAFNDDAQKMETSVEINECYIFKNVQAKQDISRMTNNNFKLIFNHISECTLEKSLSQVLPDLNPYWTTISQVKYTPVDTIIDMLAVCYEIGPLSTVTRKADSTDVVKKEIMLIDESSKKIKLTLWGNQAKSFPGSQSDIVEIRRVKVSGYGNKSITGTFATSFRVNPEIPKAKHLINWFNTLCDSDTFESLTEVNQYTAPRCFLADIDCDLNEKKLGDIELFSCEVKLISLNSESALYFKCTTDKCQKKIVAENDVYTCPKCGSKITSPQPALFLKVGIKDSTDVLTAVIFNTQAELLLGKSAQEMSDLLLSNENEYKMILEGILESNFKVTIKRRVSEFNGFKQMQCEVIKCEPLEEDFMQAQAKRQKLQ